MLLTGGSAVVESLSGVPTVAGNFLLPVGVVLYTMFGGIKATFLTDYVHTVIILVIIFVFAFSTYATNENLGSPGRVWELLTQAGKDHPVDGNKDGSYLTMQSREGAIFFVINIVGNFGTVFLDNGYYNKAIAASPVHALPGYIFGGLSWFAIPWLCATTMGMAALSLENNPVFPTYPGRIPDQEVTAGLVLPHAAVALLGKGGAAATVLLIFMAVTSASSAELIAVSSIFTYDVYKNYINPQATGRFLIRMSHVACVVYAVCMAAFATGLYYAGIGELGLLSTTDLFLGSDTATGWLIEVHYRNGLHLPHDGLHYLFGCDTGNTDSHLERPELDRGRRLSRPRSGLRPYRLARHRPKTVRRPHRRLHRLQLPYARRQRHCPTQSLDLCAGTHVRFWPAEVRLALHGGHQPGRRQRHRRETAH